MSKIYNESVENREFWEEFDMINERTTRAKTIAAEKFATQNDKVKKVEKMLIK